MEQRPIKYTFEDIRRYREGRMTKEEMHAFERASMEDPFLSDALEGFMEADMNTSAAHLQNIKEKISNKEEEGAKVVAMPQRNFKMWRVAAALLLTAGAALLIYRTMTSSVDENGVAKTNEKKETPAQVQTPVDTATSLAGVQNERKDSQTPIESTTSGAASKPAKDDKQIASIKKNNELRRDQSASPAPVYNDVVTLEQQQSKYEQPEPSKKETDRKDNVARASDKSITNKDDNAYSNNSGNELRGRVAGLNNQPLRGATIRIDNGKRSLVTDRNGNFRLNVDDTLVNASVSSVGYDVANLQLRANTDNNVQLQQGNTTLEEVVVTGYGVKQSKSISGSVTKIVDTSFVAPVGGWTAFNEYFIGRISQVADTAGRKEVQLEFNITRNGTPKNIKVINSTDTTLNKPSIEALKFGPKWTSKQPKKKTRIIIPL